MNEYQQARKTRAEELAERFAVLGYKTELIPDDEYNYTVVINGNYQARIWHEGVVEISEYPYRLTGKVISNYKWSDVRKEIFKSNKMKVLTKKKIDEKIAEIDAFKKQIDALEVEYIAKHILFLQSLRGVDGVVFDYEHEYRTIDGEYKQVKTDKIIGGEIVKNGIVYEFRLLHDGYIQQTTKMHYSVDNTLEAFLAISDNNYRKSESR